MDEAIYSSGVPLSRLKAWLGEPIDSVDDVGDAFSVRMTRVIDGTECHQDVPNTGLAWDCLDFEKTFRSIHRVAADASESAAEHIMQTLFVASQMHLLTQCRAECIGDDQWVIRHQCVKHFSERLR